MDLSPSWPKNNGALEFQNVSICYCGDGLPLALDGLSFRVEPGKRCGVVGRTGAGKSTLTIALVFQLEEIESDKIVIGGVDVSKIGLSDLRSCAHSHHPTRPISVSMDPQRVF